MCYLHHQQLVNKSTIVRNLFDFGAKFPNYNVSEKQLSVHTTNKKLIINQIEMHFDQIDQAIKEINYSFLTIRHHHS